MQKLGLNEIRERYLSFFESKGHLRLPSFSLVPQNDPSILLINAGMTPMKRYFTGQDEPPRSRVTTCQKCIRTPDIERVGQTARHGTYFEMLGNFSFGDYFKSEAIPWAWEFLTEVLEIPEEKLSVSVFHEDDEAYRIWHEVVGLPESKIVKLGKEDNFWEHGTGPCGPCSEIFFDRGEDPNCPNPDTCSPGCDCDRYVEIWNLVFTQFDRQEDGSYLPLKQCNIDTGGGLERFASVMQGVDNLFEVDTVRSILDHVCKIANCEYGKDAKQDIYIRVVTDHIRSTTMMIADGITPGNSGRGYVLRRLLRRAARCGRLLGIDRPFLCELAESVMNASGDAYPELIEHKTFILHIISTEERRFDATIRQGLSFLEDYIQKAKASGNTCLAGEEVFKLHDTFGFPVDLTAEIAAEEGLTIDREGFTKEMALQKQKAKQALLEKAESAWTGLTLPKEVDRSNPTSFVGYDDLSSEAKLLYILRPLTDEEKEVSEASATQQASFVLLNSIDANDFEEGEAQPLVLIFDQTPFYAEGGGQVGDKGQVLSQKDDLLLDVVQTSKSPDGLFLHHVILSKGRIESGEMLTLQVDSALRMASARNHSATHMLHKALRDVLGEHVTQAGSLVTPERLRFDFHHFQAMTHDELQAVEASVQHQILQGSPVLVKHMDIQTAKAQGAMALFDEKYGDAVRTVRMGDSFELCGGTHLKNTAEACYFRIVSESSVAAGVRRVEAVTGTAAFAYAQTEHKLLETLSDKLKVSIPASLEKLDRILSDLKALEREKKLLQSKLQESESSELLKFVETISGIKVLVYFVKDSDADGLMAIVDRLSVDLSPAVLILGTESNGKLNFVVSVAKELTKKGLHAGSIVKVAAKAAGGGGGGRPDLARAGAKDLDKKDEALDLAKAELLRQMEASGAF